MVFSELEEKDILMKAAEPNVKKRYKESGEWNEIHSNPNLRNKYFKDIEKEKERWELI